MSGPAASSPSEAPLGHGSAAVLLLSAIAGFADAAGYLALFGLFTAHVTGNFVTAGAAIARQTQEGVVARLVMIPTFMIAVAAATIVGRRIRRGGKDPLTFLLSLMTLTMALFWSLGVALQPAARSPDASAVVIIGASGVVALGVQNALMREALGTMSPTTVMTGNLTLVTIDLVQLLSSPPDATPPEGRAQARSETLDHLRKFGAPVLGFFGGAALGAWGTGAYGLWALGLPTLAAGALTVAAFRAARLRNRLARQGSPA